MKRAFSSTGNLVVESGTVTIAEDASWKDVSRVVATGSGAVTIERSSGALSKPVFGKRTEVHLSDDAVLTIPNGSVQRVAYLFVDGVEQPVGNYSYGSIADPDVKKHFAPTTGILQCRGNPGMMILVM